MAFARKKAKVEQLRADDAFEYEVAEDNAYAEQASAGYRMDPRARKIAVIGICLVALYAFALVMPQDLLSPGMLATRPSEGYTFSWFVSDLMQNVSDLAAVLTGNADSASLGYVSRMIRYVVVALAGAGLALTGAVYQGTFRNALVAPSTLGVMTGASFGLMLWVVLFADSGAVLYMLSSGALDATAEGGVLPLLATQAGAAVMSFVGCFVVVGLVLVTMRAAGGGTSPIIMIITGQMVGGVLGAISGLVRYYYVTTDPYGTIADLLTNLAIASFWRKFELFDIIVLTIPLAITFLVVMSLRQKMMILSLDEGEQRAMGVDIKLVRYAVVALCTLLTAIIVSFCGSVGFVGFLVPHMARRLVGPNFKYLLPATTVLGGLFVLGAYELLLVTLGADFETMVGMFISIGGAAVFLVTALRGKGVSLGGFR